MATINNLRSRTVFDNFGLPELYGSQGSYPQDPFGGVSFGAPVEEEQEDPLFGPPKLDLAPLRRETVGGSGPNDFAEIMRQYQSEYKPETQDTERFRQLLDEYPERENPSIWRRLMAAGAGMGNTDLRQPGGPEAADRVLYAPYYRDIAEWKERAGPYYNAANLERQNNIQERTLVTNAITAKTQADKIAQQQREADQKNEAAVERNRILRIKAEMGPGWRMDARNFTTVKLFNEATGEMRDTGISTLWMNEADKVEAEGKARVEAARPTPGGAAPQQQSSKRIQDDILRSAYNNPIFREFIIPPATATGDWLLDEPPPETAGGFMGIGASPNPKVQAYNQLLKALGQPPIPSQQQAAQAVPQPQQQRTAPPPVPQTQVAPQVDPFAQQTQNQDPFAQPSMGDIELPPMGTTTGPNESFGQNVGSRFRDVMKPRPPQEQAPVQQQVMTREQQMAEVAAGRRVIVIDRNGKPVGTLEATDQLGIEEQVRAGNRVSTPVGR